MPHPHQANNLYHCQRKQRGVALLVMLVIMVLGAAVFLVSSLNTSALKNAQQEKTTAALAQAKEALIGYAVNFDPSTGRPGDLPCPDTNNDGVAETSCGNASGSTGQNLRLGRLPWKTLGLPDLRDGSGERLWYAVSNNFKNNTRTTCTNFNLTGCLNSDTVGTITVRSSDGNIINDASLGNGVVAVIISPGDVLQRQGGVQQDRSSAGINTASNYLDIANGIDNANFTDSTTNGFIQGPILDSNGNTIVNDQLLIITKQHIIPLLEKRVAAEVKHCLVEYAANPNNQGPSPNQGYYPFATWRGTGSPVTYNDSDSLIFGHVPDLPFAQTCSNTGGSPCGSGGGMDDNWGPTCTLSNFNWWVNWKEMVFFGYPNLFRPHNLSHNHACSNTTCLVVNPPSTTADKNFVVIVAGEKLPGQTRPSNNWSDYLEGGNATGTSPFQQSPRSTTFNDTVVFQ